MGSWSGYEQNIQRTAKSTNLILMHYVSSYPFSLPKAVVSYLSPGHQLASLYFHPGYFAQSLDAFSAQCNRNLFSKARSPVLIILYTCTCSHMLFMLFSHLFPFGSVTTSVYIYVRMHTDTKVNVAMIQVNPRWRTLYELHHPFRGRHALEPQLRFAAPHKRQLLRWPNLVP